MTKVYVARKIPEAGLSLLQNEFSVQVHEGPLPPTREELLEWVQGADGILSLLSDRIDAEVCEAAGPQLKVVSNFAVGFNNIDVPEMRRRNIVVGNTPDVLTEATADIAVCLLLAAARRVKQGMLDVQRGSWNTWEPMGWIGADFTSDSPSQPKTLGIVGMGRIGEAVATRMHRGWGVRILYTARSAKPSVENELHAKRVELRELLETSDFISLHVPLTDQTRHLLGPEEFRCMKPNAVLVNTARGEIIDQAALIETLQERRILAAGLDVCTPEPIAPDSPLAQLDNCLLLPHIGSATRLTRDAMSVRAAQNIVAGVSNKPLPFEVT